MRDCFLRLIDELLDLMELPLEAELMFEMLASVRDMLEIDDCLPDDALKELCP